MAEADSLPGPTRFTRRSATFIGSLTLVARIVERLGAFGQIAVIASLYGSSFVADRYFVASIVPLIIGAIVAEALSANIVPALVRSDAAAPRLVGAGLWLSVALLLAASAVYVGAIAVVVPRAAPTGTTSLGVWLVLTPIAALLGLSGYLTGVLTYYERYAWPPFRSAVATVAGFVLMLAAAAFTRDLVWIAAAVTTGYAVSFAALLVEIRRVAGAAAFRLPRRDSLVDAFALRGGLRAPILGGLLGGQIFVLLERAFASTLGVGAVATLSYARGVVFTPVIAAQSIALGIYPGMVRAYEARALDYVRTALLRGLRLTLFIAVATAAFFALFGGDVIDVLLRRGELDPAAADRAADVLAAFALALLGNMLMIFVARVFYAVAHFRGVVWTQAWALVVYAVVAFPLRALWGTVGLAVAFGIAEALAAAGGVALAARRVELSAATVLRAAIVPAVVAGTIVVGAVAGARAFVDAGNAGGHSATRLAVAAAVAAAAGAAVLWWSSWPEVEPLKRTVRRLGRLRAT